ncbi:hypothetical protein HJC23_009612 [Cyclotella cryptica]|uniref:SHSP domain-containing protein n=1 Tax=Cyclotella cryptica TaxID=29204 RepID=A0ABD3NUE2_9STRA
MKTTSIFHSKFFAIAVALSLGVSVQAAYHMAMRTRPSMSLGTMMLPKLSRQSFFSRDVAQVMRDFDEMFDSMAMMRDFDDMFYEPFAIQERLMSGPPYLLPSSPDKTSLALGLPKQTYEISQDEKQLQIKVNVPGTEAGDVDVQFDEEKRLLKISGKSKREDKGISVHSSFERTFSMNRDIDTSNISARMENGGLLITAPKYDNVKESMRRIDIIDAGNTSEVTSHVNGKEGDGVSTVFTKESEAKAPADDTIIDLDAQ